MKNKKKLTMILAVATASVTALSVVAGCQTPNGCDHAGGNAYRVTEVLEYATCSKKGKEQRKCGICGDVKEFDTPVDPDNHDYGEWNVTKPTKSSKGSAEQVCRNNSAHKKNVELPVIAGNTYETEITKRPTSVSKGERTYTYKSELGDIKFTEDIPVRELETMDDYIYMATSLGDHIRKAVGYRNDAKTEETSQNREFSYEFGDNLTYVIDDSSKSQAWYSLDENGKPFGVYQEVRVSIDTTGSGNLVVEETSDPEYVNDVSENHLKGYQYTSGGGDQFITFGAENALLTYYEAAYLANELGLAVNYDESFTKQPGGEATGAFSYGYYWGTTFCRYEVEFTLYATNEIKSLSITTEVIRAYMIAEDEDGNKLFYENGDVIFAEEYASDPATAAPLYEYDAAGNVVYDTDAEGNPVYKKDVNGVELKDAHGNPIRRIKPQTGTATGWYGDNHSEVSYRIINYTLQTLATPADVPMENPYKPDSLYIKSFGLTYKNKPVTDETLEVNAASEVRLSVADIQPATASLKVDPLKVYVRLPSGDIPLTMNENDNPKKVRGSFSNTEGGAVSLNFYSAEPVTIVVKSTGGTAEKVVNFNVLPGAPESITGQAYTYSCAGGFISYDWDSTEPAEVLVNQPLYLKAIANGGIGNADMSIRVECGEPDSEGNIIADSRITFEEVEFDGQTVVRAIATEADLYTVYIFCKNYNVYTAFDIEVKNPPAYQNLLSGEYQTTFGYFKPAGGATQRDVSAKFTFANEGNWKQGTISIEIGEDEEKKQWVYSYAFDSAANKLTAAYVSGDKDATYNFTFGINEAYSITVTHFTGIGDEQETRALYVPSAQE